MIRGIAAALAAAASVAVALGGAASANRPLRVALVFEPGGPTGTLREELVGLKRGVKALGVEGRSVTLTLKEDWVAALSRLASQRYDLIIVETTLGVPALDVAARRFPGTKFAVVDAPVEALPHRPKNVAGTVARVEQAGYLAGYLAGLVERGRPGKDVISSVGGYKIPVVDAFIAGYQAGARTADPGITTLNGYAQSFRDQAKCRAVALGQIAGGSKVVFNVAGTGPACGLGALDAAKEEGVWGVGVDADESYLGPHILTSAVKGAGGVATFELIRALVRGRFPGGRNLVFDVRHGGVGLGKISPRVPRALVAKVERIRQQIASGAIRNIPTAVR